MLKSHRVGIINSRVKCTVLNLNPDAIDIMPTSEWLSFIFTTRPLIFLCHGKTEFCSKWYIHREFSTSEWISQRVIWKISMKNLFSCISVTASVFFFCLIPLWMFSQFKRLAMGLVYNLSNLNGSTRDFWCLEIVKMGLKLKSSLA